MAAVAAAVAGVQPGQWLLGGSWDESRWGGQMPSADWIDAGEEFTAKVHNVQGGRLAVPGVYSRWESPAGIDACTMLLSCGCGCLSSHPVPTALPLPLLLQPQGTCPPGCCAMTATWLWPTAPPCAWLASLLPLPTRLAELS